MFLCSYLLLVHFNAIWPLLSIFDALLCIHRIYDSINRMSFHRQCLSFLLAFLDFSSLLCMISEIMSRCLCRTKESLTVVVLVPILMVRSLIIHGYCLSPFWLHLLYSFFLRRVLGCIVIHYISTSISKNGLLIELFIKETAFIFTFSFQACWKLLSTLNLKLTSLMFILG